tara:strand:+ start:481 stop:879 length:399 start_codon:yes stop_codon:yes gene_type:complete
MATITPTITLTANDSSHATTPGPLSFSLLLNKSNATTVNGRVIAEIEGVTTTHTNHKIFDSSSMGHAYIYVSNPSDREIFLAEDDAASTGKRFMSIGPGEFAYFPWSGTKDIFADHTGSGTKNLEYFIFQKA